MNNIVTHISDSGNVYHWDNNGVPILREKIVQQETYNGVSKETLAPFFDVTWISEVPIRPTFITFYGYRLPV